MKAIPVRQLLSIQKEKFCNSLTGAFNVLYEDSVVTTMTSNELTFNRYIWEPLKLIPNVRITSEYDIRKSFGDYYKKRSVMVVMSKMLSAAWFEYIQNDSTKMWLMDDLRRSFMETVNSIRNDIVASNVHHGGSMCAMDYVMLQSDPELQTIIGNLSEYPTPKAISDAYSKLMTICKKKDHSDNPVAVGYISEIYNRQQMNKLLVCRGYMADLDGSVYKKPIVGNYVMGLRDMCEVGLDSRMAAKAYDIVNGTISTSEYLARGFQLVVMVVTKLSYVDCGSESYLEWVVLESHLKALKGKYYLCDETNVLRFIKGDERHLIGKLIKLRYIGGCKHTNPTMVCSYCFGMIGLNIPLHSNIGHVATTSIMTKFVQGMLGAKHDTNTGDVEMVRLSSSAIKFFVVKNKDYIYLRSNILKRTTTTLQLLISEEYITGLDVVLRTSDVRKLSPTRISNIPEIYLVTIHKHKHKPMTCDLVDITSGEDNSCLTYEFLAHVLTSGYTLNDRGMYVIPLDGWCGTKPIFHISRKELTHISIINKVKSMMRFMPIGSNGCGLDGQESIVQKLFDLVNSKTNINLSHIEVLVHAFSCMEPGNYQLSRRGEGKLIKMTNAITSRSLSAGLGWEDTIPILTSAKSMYGNNNISLPLDVILMPREVINGSKEDV